MPTFNMNKYNNVVHSFDGMDIVCRAADGHAHSERIACPFPGRHRVHTYDDQDGGDSECRIYFRSGCDTSSSMDVVNSCTLRPGLHRGFLHCRHISTGLLVTTERTQ